MPTRSARSTLAELAFIDAPDDPSWAHETVPAGGGEQLPVDARVLEVEVAGAGTTWDLATWRDATHSTSLLVLHGGTVVHEWYAAGLGPRTRFLGASMTKSVLAHLVGRAVGEGVVALDDEVCAHVPELRGTGYAGTRLVDVLTMTSGVDWAEDHRDPGSLASRLLDCFADAGDSRRLLASVRSGVAPGTRFAYCTADSQVLDWVRERATGRSFVDDLALLWRELGCTSDAAVVVDRSGVALAGGGMSASARDWARVAMLAVDGTARGHRVLDASWVEAAARPAYPFLAPGRLPSTITTHAGFGYHWWPMDGARDRVTADGSRGQLAAVDRGTGAIVVKTSLWPYDDAWADRQYRDLSYLGLHSLLDTAHHPRQPERTPT
jgi:hypothetical protein